MSLTPAFGLLGAATCAVWCPGGRLGRLRAPPWTILFGAAIVAGGSEGVLTAWAGASLAALCMFAWAALHAPRARPLFVASAAAVALAMSLHLLRGYHDPLPGAALRLTPDALPFVPHLNFDKAAAGLVLLATFAARARSPRIFAGQLGPIAVAAAATASAAIGLALAAGVVRFEPKLPDIAPPFLVANLLFTCVAEEAFFRGLIQERLMRLAASSGSTAWTAGAIAASAALFGLAHAGGGAPWMLISAVAGAGYAGLYARTRSIEGPILVHFAVNAAHFLGFTYPALAG
ncbi:MAG: CPBP family intramembrane glutamic endopeptidase [Burkholderiaceae bacterium]